MLLAIGGAAVMATGLAGTVNAQVVAAGPGACEAYASEYAAVNAPRFGLFGWNAAYRHAYNECTVGGPTFVSAYPYGYRAPYVASTALAAPVYAGAQIAGSALYAGANLAGTALSIPGAILGGTASALAPAAPVVTPDPVVEPEVVKNYRGTYEAEAVAVVDAPETTSSAALAVPADATAPAQFTPEWYAYCEAKYRSFNPETGMYLAYSGTYRMCN
jgi:hypothetical protein